MSYENIFESIPDTNCETEEEKIIKSLVDDIYDYEEKILEINSILEKSTNQSNFDDNIIILKRKQNELKDKINLIKIQENDEINKKQNIINVKQNILNNIENQLNECINKLTTYNTLSFSSLIMTKYIISNNINEFLTKEQIDDIINNSIQNQNYNINNNKLDKNSNNNLENEIDEEINKLNNKINQINENLCMMKEEKKNVNNEIIELISCKETIDSLVRTSLNNLIDYNSNNNNNYNNVINKDEEEMEENEYNNKDENNNIILPEIFSYELSILDTNKISKNICNELYDIFNIKNSQPNNKISNKNINININNNNNNGINDIEEYNKELSLNLSEIKPKKEDEDNFNKNNLEILIKSELDTFLLNEIKNKDIINNLFENLCIIISTKLQLLDVEDISNEKLKIFLLYYFKSIYYDNIIENKFKFINKEYKILKKEGKKNLESLKNELNILVNKKEEIESKKANNKTKKLNNNYNYINEGGINLTKSEQEYIQICSKGNSLLKQKEEIINIINSLEKSIVKRQLERYKSKYGSNLGIYNRLIDGINDTIKQTYNKYPFEESNNLDLNNNINNNNNNIFKKDDINQNQINNSIILDDNNYNLINKLMPLTKNTICYFREITNLSNKFNPLSDNISVQSLIEPPYNFNKSMIALNKSFDNISFISSNVNYTYNLYQIDNTIMNSNLKIIIEIHRDYRKFKSVNKNNNNNNSSLKDFVKKEKLKYFSYDNKFIEKCALNKLYNFSLLISEGKRIEIILCSYEDFKLWINGFAFIIKNKKQIMKMKKA